MITPTIPNAPVTVAPGVHPSMPVPFELLIHGRRFQGKGLSVVSGKAVGLLEPELDGRREVALVQFYFEGFAVTLEVDVELTLHETGEENWLEFTFLDPTGPHLPQLRHILNSFIAGDLITLGAVLKPAADARNAPAAKPKGRAAGRMLGGAVRGVVTLSLTVGLVWTALALIESRMLTVTEARPAIVTLPGEVLRAPSAGQIEFLNPGAGEGDVAFSILSNSGILLSLKMPCDCTFADVATFEGATVLAGEPVLRLADTESAPVINAQLSEQSLAAVVAGYSIELRRPDGTTIPARLGENAAREITAQDDNGVVAVTLVPDTPLPEAAAGTLLSLRLKRSTILSGVSLKTLHDRVASLLGISPADPKSIQLAAGGQ